MKIFYVPLLLLLFFTTAKSQNIIRIGSNGGAGSFVLAANTYGPFTTNTAISWNRHAYIYPANLLSGMPPNSNIDSLFFSRLSSNGVYGMLGGTVNCKIYFKNTTATDFGVSALDWPTEVSTTTLVYNNNPTSIIGSTGGFKKFILTVPFIYTGSNLEVLVEYTQSAPATGEVVWGYDNNATVPDYLDNSTKYISGTSGSPTNSLSNSNYRHPALILAYTSLNPIDASLEDILTSNISCYSSLQSISVVIKNRGTTPISAGTANVTLDVSGANVFTAAKTNIGIIAPNSTEIINFTGINLNNVGTDDITATVTVSGDLVTGNNSGTTQTITADVITSFPAVEDVETTLPVFGYVSTIAIAQAWIIQDGNYSNIDLASPLTPHGGNSFFLFDSYDANPGTVTRLFSNCLKLTSGATNSITFYMSHDDSYADNFDSLFVSVSTDKGLSWTRLAGFGRYDAAFTSPGWKMETVNLSAYQGQTVQIGFEGAGDFGNVIGLDDITIISNGITPVTLLSFNAKQSGAVNALSWITSQELNSLYFGVEHSVDGVHFNQIGRVDAAGNSSIQHSYGFNDPNPFIGINYYRLRIVDIDNSAKYSLVRNVKNTGVVNFSIYPNPVRSDLNINIDAESIDKVGISISDVNGRNVYKSKVNIVPGTNTVPVDVSNLASGTYFLKIQMTEKNIIKKFNKE